MSSATETAVAEVLAADDARYAAMIARDFAALGQLLADDLLYTHSTAVTDTKTAYLAAVQSGKYRYKHARREGVLVRVHGTTAIVHGSLTIDLDVDGEPTTLRNVFLSVWVKTEGGWQMAAWQSLPVSPATATD